MTCLGGPFFSGHGVQQATKTTERPVELSSAVSRHGIGWTCDWQRRAAIQDMRLAACFSLTLTLRFLRLSVLWATRCRSNW